MEGENTELKRRSGAVNKTAVSPMAIESQALYVSLPSTVIGSTPMNAEIFTNADRDSLIQMFVDGTNNETYGKGRLLTREVGESRTELIAYGWNKIAEYDSETQVVTLFAGHSGDVSPTVTRYVNLVREIAGKRRSRKLNVIDTSPNLQGNVPTESAQFIQNYRNFDNNPSPIEEWATQTVETAVGNAARALL